MGRPPSPDESRTVLGSIQHFIHSRSSGSWAKLFGFYLAYYTFLAAFFTVCMVSLVASLDDKVPTIVGRSNKLALAIEEKNIYKMNFKNAGEWQSYKEAAKRLRDSYGSNVKPTGSSATWFEWTEENLGPCSKDSVNFAFNEDGKMEGCFFMGINRLIGWEPFPGGETDRHLIIKCGWIIGLSGEGNLDPPVTTTMYPYIGTQQLEMYYPWSSLAEQGKQPLVAVHVKIDIDEALTTADTDVHTYLECLPYESNVATGTDTAIPGAQAALFEIIYPNKA